MNHKTFLLAVGSLSLCAIGAVIACSGKTLDIGSNGAAPLSNAPPRDADTDGPDGASFSGLTLDDVVCAVWLDNVTSYPSTWPSYELEVRAICPGHGEVYVQLDSRADLAYPRNCRTASLLRVAVQLESDVPVVAEVDGGVVTAFWSDASYSSCTVDVGPSLVVPGAPVSLYGTVSDGRGHTHRVRYASIEADAGAAAPPWDDAGGGCLSDAGECNQDPDAGGDWPPISDASAATDAYADAAVIDSGVPDAGQWPIDSGVPFAGQ